MALKISCPGCQRKMTVPDNAPGKQIRCPACKERFTVETDEDAPESDEASTREGITARKKLPPPVRNRKVEPKPKAARSAPKKGVFLGVLAAGLGGVALLGCLGLGGVLLLFGSFRDTPQEAAANKHAPPVEAPKQADPPKQIDAPKQVDAPKPGGEKFNLAETRKSVVFLRVFTPGLPPSSGSGFLVTPDGLIATNRHVLDAENGFPPGGKIVVGVPRPDDPDAFDYFLGELAYVAPKGDPTDFALVKIAAAKNAPPFKALPLLARDGATLGTEVAALGYPFANAEQVNLSFTKGSISSTKVLFDAKAFYQTDAAVNPGNSGGPLVNANGDAVGIVTLRRNNAENVGFALYLGETNLRNLSKAKLAAVQPPAGPLGPEARPTVRTVRAKRENWKLEKGSAKEIKNLVALEGDKDGSFWVTSNDELPPNFQVSFLTLIADDGAKGSQQIIIPRGPIGPRNPIGKQPKQPVRVITNSAPALLAVRLTNAQTNSDIIAGDGVTFLQSNQGLQVLANRQNTGSAPTPIEGLFLVTLLRSGDTISYFINGKEQMRGKLPTGSGNKVRLSIGGARGLVVLTDLCVEHYTGPTDLATLPRDAWAQFNTSVDKLLARDPATAGDFKKYIDANGWKDRLTPYAVIYGHFAARQAGNEAVAAQFLADAAGKFDEEWPAPLLKFLRGQLDEQAVLAQAKDKGEQTEVHCYLGLDHALKGRKDEAIVHFRWVAERGAKTFVEYRVAVAELARLQPMQVAKEKTGGDPPVKEAPGGKVTDKGVATKILGSGSDPEFSDAAPAGGILVGFEIGLGKFFNKDNIAAARPIYRVGAEEKLGNQYGTNTTRVVRVVAKPGYAVGAVTVKQGLAIAGMSITFMKLNNGRLDPADSYESEWLAGTGGGQPVRVGSTGAPVIGIVGRNNKTNMTGIGLLLQP